MGRSSHPGEKDEKRRLSRKKAKQQTKARKALEAKRGN